MKIHSKLFGCLLTGGSAFGMMSTSCGEDKIGHSAAAISAGDACNPAPAYDFVYPVAGVSAPSGGQNTVNPQDDGWYVWNCFGNPCTGCGCGQTDCRQALHPGTDWNLRASCAADDDRGKPVVAVANGVVVLVRDLGSRKRAVVIRHDLPEPVDVTPYLLSGTTVPAEERSVRTVYSVAIHTDDVVVHMGDCVTKGQQIAVIGFMSGNSHLHSEIVRPSPQYIDLLRRGFVAATASGYYVTPQQLTDNGHIDGVAFLRDHRLTWHPPGTLVLDRDGYAVLAAEGGRTVKRTLTASRLHAWRYDAARAVILSPGESDCYDVGTPIPDPPTYALYRTTTSSIVYRVDEAAKRRDPFISEQAFFSWGYSFNEVKTISPFSFDGLRYATYGIGPSLGLREGSLFRTQSDPPVYQVAEGVARHIADQDLFTLMGYRDDEIFRVGDGTETQVTAGIGQPIIFSTIHRCENGRSVRAAHPCREACLPNVPDDGHGGGGCADADGDGFPDAACGGTDCDDADPATKPGAPEACNGRDDDCDGVADDGIDTQWDTGNCGGCGISCLRPHAAQFCVRGACEWSGCDAGWSNANGSWDDGCEAPATPAKPTAPDAGAPTKPDTGCGHSVRYRFTGFDGVWQFGADTNPSWYVSVTGSLDKTVSCVGAGWHLANGYFPAENTWLCNEWPLGTFAQPFGPLAVEVDGAAVAVSPWHDPSIPGGVGCNLRFCVGGACP